MQPVAVVRISPERVIVLLSPPYIPVPNMPLLVIEPSMVTVLLLPRIMASSAVVNSEVEVRVIVLLSSAYIPVPDMPLLVIEPAIVRVLLSEALMQGDEGTAILPVTVRVSFGASGTGAVPPLVVVELPLTI